MSTYKASGPFEINYPFLISANLSSYSYFVTLTSIRRAGFEPRLPDPRNHLKQSHFPPRVTKTSAAFVASRRVTPTSARCASAAFPRPSWRKGRSSSASSAVAAVVLAELAGSY